MKSFTKLVESMLTKPAMPTWTGTPTVTGSPVVVGTLASGMWK